MEFSFGHMADLHMGSHSQDQKLSKIEQDALDRIVNDCIRRKIDFLIISGDLFDNHYCDLVVVNATVEKLKKLRDAKIRIYAVHGSHDYCAGGKSIFDVLCSTGLITNVFNYKYVDGKLVLMFTIDTETGVKIVGIPGETMGVEDKYYRKLNKECIENENGFKIFVFHSAIEGFYYAHGEDDVKIRKDHLPKGFDYYAGGHLHAMSKNENFLDEYKCINFPGIPFAIDEKDVRMNKERGFYIVHFDNNTKILESEIIPVDVCRYILDTCNIEDDDSVTKLMNNIFSCDIDENSIACIDILGPYMKDGTEELKQKIRIALSNKGITNVHVDSARRNIVKHDNTVSINKNICKKENIDISIEDVFKKHIDNRVISNNIKDSSLKGDSGVKLANELLRHVSVPVDIDEDKTKYTINMVSIGLNVIKNGDEK
jgi:DNA repair exonuclease SbcCD nuclease subunit